MPLLDHFRPPLSALRHWEAFHSRWAAAVADALNDHLLPSEYYAEVQVHVGSRVEVDVATFGDSSGDPAAPAGGVAVVAPQLWSPPVATMSMPAIFPDSMEVLVLSTTGGPTLVAAVEFVSPGNKDRADARRAFAGKCANYLQQGVGVIVVDIVTNRQGNLHNELVAMTVCAPEFRMPQHSLYAVAYRPIRRPDSELIDVWTTLLRVGEPLPELPLALDRGICVPLDFELPYVEACRRSRIQ